MKITLAEDAYIPQMIEVWKEMMDYHAGLDPYYTRRDDAHLNFEKYVRMLMKSKDARVVVALDGDSVVGIAIGKIEAYPPVFQRDLHGFLDTVGVKSSHRRKEAGEKMVSDLIAWFKKRGLDRFELRVSARNPIGKSFWKKQGFKDYLHVLYKEK